MEGGVGSLVISDGGFGFVFDSFNYLVSLKIHFYIPDVDISGYLEEDIA